VKSAKEAAEESMRAAKEAAEVSKRASQEAISRAEEASKSAKETAEVSIRAAREATEASKKAAKEAAEASIRIFKDLISSTGWIGNTSQPVAKQSADASTETSEEAGEVLAATFGEVTGVAKADIEGKGGSKEVRKTVESRLESLEKMYASSKDRQTVGESEEEEEQTS